MTEVDKRVVLRRAADVLRTRGHCKDALSDEKGRCCLIGALNVAVYGSPDPTRFDGDRLEFESGLQAFHAAKRALYQVLPTTFNLSDGTPYVDIAGWNDAPERTADEVIAALEQAAGAATLVAA